MQNVCFLMTLLIDQYSNDPKFSDRYVLGVQSDQGLYCCLSFHLASFGRITLWYGLFVRILGFITAKFDGTRNLGTFICSIRHNVEFRAKIRNICKTLVLLYKSGI